MKHWIMTGANRGVGRVFAEAAGAGRQGCSKDARWGGAVVPLTLDGTDRARCFAGVTQAAESLGPWDVVVNTAGYRLFGMVQELTEEQLRHQMAVTFFCLLHRTQAMLQVLWAQGSVLVAPLSTLGGVTTFPGLGLYHVSNWVVEGPGEALAQDVAGFGIKVTLVEPGAYATDLAVDQASHAAPIAACDGVRAALAARQLPA